MEAGTRLGPYEILAPLGKGGMGEVYRARDTRLDRDVALKVLPEAFTSDAERLARFEREAKVLASLNHPNIGGIHGLEEADGVQALVLELVEGPTLADRIAEGPLSLDEALPIARQIAGALEAAHERGVVHRDLKPANIKITGAGEVKVLDFGLAKAYEPEGAPASHDISASPTVAEATRIGMILGTAAYMSPEQAKGEEVDKRSDIWSFGVVLWEMLTGRKLFDEGTVSETLAAVLKTEPDHSTLVTTVPWGVRRVLERCLQKDPSQRLHDIADARLEIEAVMRGDDPAMAVAGPGLARVGGGPWKMVAALAALVAIVALATHLLPSAADPPAHAGSRFALRIPSSDTYSVLQNSALAISPDGRTLAYAAEPSDPSAFSEIYLQRLDSFEPEIVSDTLGGYAPFFSPDGEWLGYFRGTGMWKKTVRGGPPTRLAPVGGMARGASWTDDGRIFYAPTWFSPVLQVSADGGEPKPVTTLLEGEKSHRFPSVLPDGSAVIFTVGRADTDSFDDASIVIQSTASGERSVLVEGGSFGRFLPPDRLLYGWRGSLLLAGLDVERLELVGSPTPVIDDLLTSPIFGSSQFSVSASGTLAYLAGSPERFSSRTVEVSRAGEITELPLPPGSYSMVRASPDGERLALRIDGANGQIWVYDVERGTLSRITREWDADFPAWHPEGESLAYVLSKGESSEIARVRSDGTGEPEVLWSGGSNVTYPSWTPDGRSLVFSDAGEDTEFDLWILDLDGEPAATPYLRTPADEADAVVSPDGNWLAYTSNQSGRSEIYVQAYPVPGRRWQVSARGGTSAIWSPAGDELLFQNGDEIMAVPVELGAEFEAGIPRSLFHLPDVARGDSTRSFARWRDGRYLAVLPPEGWQPTGRLHLILDWTATLPAF